MVGRNADTSREVSAQSAGLAADALAVSGYDICGDSGYIYEYIFWFLHVCAKNVRNREIYVDRCELIGCSLSSHETRLTRRHVYITCMTRAVGKFAWTFILLASWLAECYSRVSRILVSINYLLYSDL